MGHLGDPIPSAGPPLTPMQVVSAIRWSGDYKPDEIVRAIQLAADVDHARHWPELSDRDVATLREQARDMTKSRLRAWQAGGERQPTWLEVRALISGLHALVE